MNDLNSRKVLVERIWKSLAILGILVVIGMVAFLVLIDALLGGTLMMAIGTLLVGWLAFLVRVSRQITLDWPAISSSAAVLGLFVLGFHSFVASALKRRNRSIEDPTTAWQWSWRYTFSTVALTLVLFAAGTAMVGIAHQWAWHA